MVYANEWFSAKSIGDPMRSLYYIAMIYELVLLLQYWLLSTLHSVRSFRSRLRRVIDFLVWIRPMIQSKGSFNYQ